MATNKNYDAYLAAENKMEQQQKELSQLIEYPPFSEIDDGKDSLDYDGVNPNWGFPGVSERGLQLQEAVRDAIKMMNEETEGVNYYDSDPSIVAKCFKEVYDEFSDDLEEARLMQKRYPTVPLTALKSYKIK